MKKYVSKKLALVESRANARNRKNILMEDIISDLKKHPRSAADAKAEARGAVIKGFNPYAALVRLHKDAVQAVLRSLKNELKKAKTEENKITVSTNYIKNGQFVQPKSGVLEVGVHIYMPAKKGIFGRFLSGSMGNWFQDVGVVAMKAYVGTFGGEEYSKQVSKKTIFNACGEGENEGKVSYFCCLQIPTAGD